MVGLHCVTPQSSLGAALPPSQTKCLSVCLCVTVSVFMFSVILRPVSRAMCSGLHHHPVQPCKHHQLPHKHTTHSHLCCHFPPLLPELHLQYSHKQNLSASTEYSELGSQIIYFFTPCILSNITNQDSRQKSTDNIGCIFQSDKGYSSELYNSVKNS